MKKIFIIALILLGLSFSRQALAEIPIEAGELNAQLQAAAGEQGAAFGEASDPRMVIVNIIKIALSFLGMSFLVYTFYAGFIWMTAGGEEEKIKTAQKTMKYAVIGTLIVLCSYSIAILVQNYLYEAQSMTQSTGGWYVDIDLNLENETSDHYPNRDPLGRSATIPGYETVW